VNINLAIAERARAGELLTAAELEELATADLLSLGMLADEVRRDRVGDTVTFARVMEIGAQGPPARPETASAGSRRSSPESPRAEADAEVRISICPATLDDAILLISEGRILAGPQVLTGFSLADVIDRNWGSLGDVLRRLKGAGLDAIVEAPVDRIADMTTALKAAQDAGLPVRCLSLQKPVVGGRTDYLLQVRSIVEAFPSFTTIAPLPREQSIAVPTTGYDDVRAVALARLALPSMKHIQVDWAQYGPKLAQVALTFGANDVDRVSTQDDESLGRRRTSVEDIRRNIAAAGFTAVER